MPLDTWGPAGTVSAVARQGDTLYVGGSFDYVGPGTGPFAAFAFDSPEPDLSAGGFDGSIRVILPLPGGGWIVAGNIGQATGVSRAVARLDASGRIDPAWFVDVSGSVESLATDGTRVFVGGSFSSINGATRTSLAAVDATTGAVLSWNPILVDDAGSPSVPTLLAHQGALYVAGRFTSVNGDARAGFAAIDAVSATTLSTVLLGLTSVSTMAANGDTLYLGGRFPSFQDGGVALSIATGQLLPWTTLYPTSLGLVATPQRVFAASFDSVRALDPVTGALLGPPLVSSASVTAMAAGDGLLGVAIGVFGTTFGHHVITFDSANGRTRNWSVRADQRIDAVSVRGGQLALGGSFASAGGVARRNLFAMDLRNGRPTPFAPAVEGRVSALAMVGDVLVVGGDFVRVNGQDQRALAAIATDTGGLLQWSPIQSGSVLSLAFAANTLFVGGNFQVFSGYSRPNLAAVQVST
ncbi:MAG: PQQ-like beta-propeller repeat protein, partial [Acidobacteriota bacterium]|nr:PQQ-like beta-propeller repeat protein [Acidobacteriota bacterium]